MNETIFSSFVYLLLHFYMLIDLHPGHRPVRRNHLTIIIIRGTVKKTVDAPFIIITEGRFRPAVVGLVLVLVTRFKGIIEHIPEMFPHADPIKSIRRGKTGTTTLRGHPRDPRRPS